jgi:CO/xanthine dehydrogenase FAD-binding subunit
MAGGILHPVFREYAVTIFLQPTALGEAVAIKAEHPAAVPVAGGTDVLVDLNFDRMHPDMLLDLGRLPELRGSDEADGWIRLGSATTYRELSDGFACALPALAAAARTVGSPQIRNRGTLGGNLATASPAGDAHPPLLACGAQIEIRSARGTRRVPIEEFFIGPKHSVLAADELIAAVHVPRATGPQQFAKVGTRNAMVIAVCSFALALDPVRRAVRTGIGSAGPVPLRAKEAEAFAAAALDWDHRGDLRESLQERFAEMVSEVARPIDDVRGTSAYRLHALKVLASRTLRWTWDNYHSQGGKWN